MLSSANSAKQFVAERTAPMADELKPCDCAEWGNPHGCTKCDTRAADTRGDELQAELDQAYAAYGFLSDKFQDGIQRDELLREAVALLTPPHILDGAYRKRRDAFLDRAEKLGVVSDKPRPKAPT